MEQIYRRRNGYRTPPHAKEKIPGNYRKKLLRYSLFCLLLFMGCLFVKTSPNPELEPIRRSISLIVSTTTDIKNIPRYLSEQFNILTDRGEHDEKSDILTRLVPPVMAPVTSPFGLRQDPSTGEESFHYGVDLGAPGGEKIKCAASGEVTESGMSPEYGNYMVVRHSETVYTLYAHCAEVLPVAGDTVKAGQVIGTVGDTGNATGPHLHFEIRDGETWLNPEELLSFGEGEKHD